MQTFFSGCASGKQTLNNFVQVPGMAVTDKQGAHVSRFDLFPCQAANPGSASFVFASLFLRIIGL